MMPQLYVRQWLYNKADVGLQYAATLGADSNLSPTTDTSTIAGLNSDPAYLASIAILAGVDNTNASVIDAITLINNAAASSDPVGYINDNASQGAGFTLTNGTDIATANVFDGGLVYNPAGTDRINSLQSEDILTGTGNNPTLNVTLGNANDNGATSVTPMLNNINTVNLEFTGNTTTLDMRNADSLEVLAITRITAETGNRVDIENIGQLAADLTVKNTSAVFNEVHFDYSDGILDGTDCIGYCRKRQADAFTMSTQMCYTLATKLSQRASRRLELNASNTNNIKSLAVNDLEALTIKGSGNLTLADVTKTDEKIDFKGG